jgi:predicted esterase
LLALPLLALSFGAPAPPSLTQSAGGARKGATAVEATVDEDGVPSRDVAADGDPMKRFFLIGPREKKKAPKEGWGCLIVMPGGDGSADFHGFVKNIWANGCPDDFVVVQLVAPKWEPDPKVIWPMDPGDQEGMKFATREQLDATLADVVKVQKTKLDPRRTYLLAWSSGGPPTWRMALAEKPPVTASYIAMSVFHEGELQLSRAKGRAFFLDHSPEDATCKFADAQRAKEKLSKEGAAIELVTYKGGHGWHDDPMARLRKGIAWMEEHRAKPAR